MIRLSRPNHQCTIESSRINSGEFKYHSRYFDVKDVAEECYEELVEQAARENVRREAEKEKRENPLCFL